MQPPAQELVARDLHDNVWTFRHIYRGRFKFYLRIQMRNSIFYFSVNE